MAKQGTKKTAAPKADKKFSIEEILVRKKPAVFTIKFLLDPELREIENKARRRVGAAESAVTRAERRDAPVPDEVIDELTEAEAAHAAIVEDEEFAEFRMVAIGSTEMEELMAAHRPTIQQQKDFHEELKRQGLPRGENLLYNPDTFPPVLLAACCHEPEMTLAQATKLWNSDNFNRGELGELFKAAWSVNQMITA